MVSIASTDEGITSVKPSYQDPLLDTFREIMSAARTFCLEEREAGRITHKEYAMLYLQTLQTCITTSAQLARDAAEQDYKVTHLLDIDKQIKQQQVKQLKVEVALKTTQKNQNHVCRQLHVFFQTSLARFCKPTYMHPYNRPIYMICRMSFRRKSSGKPNL